MWPGIKENDRVHTQQHICWLKKPKCLKKQLEKESDALQFSTKKKKQKTVLWNRFSALSNLQLTPSKHFKVTAHNNNFKNTHTHKRQTPAWCHFLRSSWSNVHYLPSCQLIIPLILYLLAINVHLLQSAGWFTPIMALHTSEKMIRLREMNQ